MLGYGQGRLSALDCPVTLRHSVDLVKSHLQLSNVRLARAVGQQMGRFSLSAYVLRTLFEVLLDSLIYCPHCLSVSQSWLHFKIRAMKLTCLLTD